MVATKSSNDVRTSKFLKDKPLATIETQEPGQVKTKKQLEVNSTSSQVMIATNAKSIKTGSVGKSLKSVNSVQAL